MTLQVAGFRLAAVSAGIYAKRRPDLVLIECAENTTASAVFTRNRFCAAPVTVAKSHLEASSPRYLLINAGNANAGTGEAGIDDAEACCKAVADLSGVSASQVLPFSTGVIGQRLPTTKIASAIPELISQLSESAWDTAASAIMTTDLAPKIAARQITLDDKTVTIGGICKGSGMIRPDMATMLAFIATDAAVEPLMLETCLRTSVNKSFNRVTVDGDTSTNDACVLMASGRSGVSVSESHGYEQFCAAVAEVMIELAQAIARDGEGATKFITVEVTGGASAKNCEKVAYTVAESPLVKTACFASDPNWGRILAAVGRAPIDTLDIDRINIWINGVKIVADGQPDPEYTEEKGAAAMQPADILIRVDLGAGEATDRVWTCDYSYDYIKINAEYRT